MRTSQHCQSLGCHFRRVCSRAHKFYWIICAAFSSDRIRKKQSRYAKVGAHGAFVVNRTFAPIGNGIRKRTTRAVLRDLKR